VDLHAGAAVPLVHDGTSHVVRVTLGSTSDAMATSRVAALRRWAAHNRSLPKLDLRQSGAAPLRAASASS
jgi:hypothetical protein